MAKKQYFLIADTETTVNNTVADFGAVICDRKGNIVKQCAILVADHFDKMELFYNPADTGFWGKKAAETRKQDYINMLNTGQRMLASVGAINRWLEQAKAAYDPELTAYNLAFDIDKMRKTGIDCNMFSRRFCLWHAAIGNICSTKAYKQFLLENHLFRPPTELGNMAYITNAEAVAGYLKGQMSTEPHTAIEDVIDYELPILVDIVKRKRWRDKITPYNWQAHQLKDHYVVK